MCQAHTPPAKKASVLSQLTCVSLLVGVCAVWSYYTFVPSYPPHTPLHSWKVPAVLTAAYLVSLPLLKRVQIQDAKGVLMPSMILYNVGQVLLNLWTVVYIARSLAAGHPLVGDTQVRSGKNWALFSTRFFFRRGALGKTTA